MGIHTHTAKACDTDTKFLGDHYCEREISRKEEDVKDLRRHRKG
jgi:hypothetical protein